jgi:signal transduction histidine kinase
VKRVGYRGRLFAILLSFALLPSIVLSIAWGGTSWWSLPLVGAAEPWDSVASSAKRALRAVERAPLDSGQRRALNEFDRSLSDNRLYALQARYVYRRAAPIVAATVAIVTFLVLVVVSSRVAGHLSRAMSRPLQELIGWTELIGRGQKLPEGPPRRGAPEFEVLRRRMRKMAGELERGRVRAVEAERAEALRESARQVAHELKNPLTPIRFAVERLRRDSALLPAPLAETIDVLDVESKRLEAMARSFSQFGRLPEGPQAYIDVGELVRYTARSIVPPEIPLSLDVAEGTPMIRGHHDALSRALANVILNAVDACRGCATPNSASVSVSVSLLAADGNGRPADCVEIAVADTGCGIPADQVNRIWDPYVTSKPGGTGLGLAIARQTVLAHQGNVGVDSAPGRGTTIRFILPVNGPVVAEQTA